jgi:hypothetical protein
MLKLIIGLSLQTTTTRKLGDVWLQADLTHRSLIREDFPEFVISLLLTGIIKTSMNISSISVF